MPQQSPTPPSRPANPPAAPAQAPVTAGADVAPASPQAVPTTRAELDALVLKRSELTNQLESLTDRRRELASQRAQMSRQDGLEHDARLKIIDERSARIELEIAQADEAIASALATGVTTGGQTGGEQGGAATTSVPFDQQLINNVRNAAEDSVSEMIAIWVAVLVGATLVWRGLRRVFRKKAPPVPDDSARLNQLQQSIDVIAVEVERIAEAQRYVAKRLDERMSALGAGEAQPVSPREREPLHLRDDRR